LFREQILKSKILDILDSRNISPLFQPIIDISNATVFGHEALIRGPVGTKLHSPISLLSSSHLAGLLPEVESLCRETVLSRYSESKNQNKLFVNISPTCLMLTNSQFEFNIKQLESYSLKPSDIVIEITEGSTVNDYSFLKDTVARYKAYGFGIALDDLGEGFSSLRLWSEIHPNFVKIDKHFITNIQNDPIKQEFVRAIQKIATESGGLTIAEGVETRDELAVIKDLKINFAQGFLLGRPMPQFLEQLADDVKVLLFKSSITVYRDLVNNNKQATVANLITYQSTIPETFTNEQVYEMFQEDASLNSIPVVTDRKPIGLISRFDTIDRFARPYQKELHGKKPCTQFMDDSPLIVQKSMTINALSEMILNADPQYLMNGFIVVDGDDYIGTGSGHALLREITNLQISAARYANPLTSLPGNVPINSHIDRLLENGEPFIACYCDLDNFKPFNDAYGYRRGDELIQFVGRLLSNVAIDERDFVGHIGGDDFILLFQSEDWERLCNEVLNTLSKVIPDFYDSKDVEAGGIEVEDRLGNKAFYPFGSISIGAIRVEPALFKSHHEVAGAMNGVKKQAKKISGNSLFIDRRLTF
jgi:EAL domain-containing protein (putative c-di-GMP-specific phosphodiesterase class I)/GGDEF domain-containing protein